MQLRQLITELRRRRVFRATGIYIVAAWVAIQVASLVFPAIDVPDSALRYVWLAAAALLPLALIFAWSYDVTLDGITRTPPPNPRDDFDPSLRRVDTVLLLALAVVAISLTFQFITRIEPGFDRLDESINRFSIAVLPFDDLSGKTEEQFFVSGMQSSLIDSLSRVRDLRVTSKVSTLPYRETGGSPLDIAMQLGVARIVEGTVLRTGGRVSIALRLHDAEKDQQVWSATFEEDLGNVMFLQAKAAQEIANQVRAELGPEEREQFQRAQPVNPEAYLAFLRGVFHVERFNPEDMRIAASHFQRAVDIDPEYALGYWGLSKLCGFQAQVGMLTPDEAHAQCLPHAEKALELDPFLPEAYMGRAAFAAWQEFDWDVARTNFERAIELNPSYAEAHMFYAHFLGIVGELENSSEHMRRAVELDPLNPFLQGLYSVQIAMLKDFERAIATAESALSMAPGYAFGYVTLVFAHDTLGNEAEAVEAFANMLRFVAEKPEAADALTRLYGEFGYEHANLQLAEQFVQLSESEHVPPMTIAALYEHGGNHERAIDWYEAAVQRRDPDAPYIGVMVNDPETRANPRFHALLRDLKLDYWVAHH